jgi:hypothetical protein
MREKFRFIQESPSLEKRRFMRLEASNSFAQFNSERHDQWLRYRLYPYRDWLKF